MLSSLLHRRETLILTAIEIINEKEFGGLSTRELAKREGVSESAIFKHFKSKNDLIMAILDYFSQYDKAIMRSIENNKLDPVDSIYMFIDSFISYYENYPEITVIFNSYESLVSNDDFKQKIKEIFFERNNFLNSLIKDAIKKNRISLDIESEQLTDIIYGTLRGVIYKWRLLDYQFSLRSYFMAILKFILKAF
ncbi:TetR/AcrR family transcriptional regulator [Thermodesulfobium sp. 4217-1]|uniref:TetR/AcrR family transcriptional regulator n=1 Tax=Thermodesulfobium sp. 4217-1 TaxID=3120013 RepID=UPI00322144C3